MEINKEHLIDKLDTLMAKHKSLNEEIERTTILIHKVEGAIETIQLLLKEIEAEVNTNKE
jgi:ABC-type phosphate transport system auxiliary subunit